MGRPLAGSTIGPVATTRSIAPTSPRPGAGRRAIRLAVPLALLLSILGGMLLPRSGRLPGIALGTDWILYGIRTLALFYGFLLLFVPLVRALSGQLPIELTLRGARYEDEASESVDDLTRALAAETARGERLTRSLEAVLARIDALERKPSR